MANFFETERLIMRRWKKTDEEPFVAMNANAQVMEFFPKLLDAAASKKMIQKIEESFDKNGFGLWALEIKQTKEFIGFTGLSIPGFTTHFTPCVEIGWRIAPKFWGLGYAPEAAKQALLFGFNQLNLDEIVSFTAIENKKSIRVMEKIGMTHNESDDFDHPQLDQDHPLCHHVLYRLVKNAWLKRNLT